MFYAVAEREERGAALQTQACLIFCAFCVEAYLNHVGAKFLNFWDEVEPLRVMPKLRLLLKQFRLKPDFGTWPLQTISMLFKYRNWMAHSRSATIIETTEHDHPVEDSFLYAVPPHDWESFVTLANASQCMNAVKELIESINAACPEPEPLPLSTLTSHTFMAPADP